MTNIQSVWNRLREFFNPAPDVVPQNGLQGLRFLRYDLPAGFALFPVALIFALAISSISHAPPMSGIISAIIACVLFPFMGGSYLGVAGAAAALAPIIADTIDKLGHGDQVLGYSLFLPVVMCTGVLMFIIGKLKLARFAALFSDAVVESMFAWIGISLLVKQIPVFFGVKFQSQDVWGILTEIPARIPQINQSVFVIGASTLVFLATLLLLRKRLPFLRYIPAQVLAAVFALGLSYWFLLPPEFRIHLPADPFASGVVIPNFAGVWMDPSIWKDFLWAVVILTLVDAIESTATAKGIDAKDHYKRTSDPNLTLKAMGTANFIGSFFGALTHIWGGLKSSLNISLGAKTLWSGAFCGLFIFISVYFATTREVINHLPLSGLSAVIAITAGAMCAPRVWLHFAHIGLGQFAVFATGVGVAAYSREILWGMAAAMAMEFMIVYAIALWAAHKTHQPNASPFFVFRSLFRNPVASSKMIDGNYHIHLSGPVVFLNAHYIYAPSDVKAIVLHCGDEVTMVDHPSLNTIERLGKNRICLKCFDGDGGLKKLSRHEKAALVRHSSKRLMSAD